MENNSVAVSCFFGNQLNWGFYHLLVYAVLDKKSPDKLWIGISNWHGADS
jgi:hypothetical protein